MRLPHLFLAALVFAPLAALRAAEPVPVIDVTDLYHPHQDVGDNFDVLAAYALPEIDLRAVILDCTERDAHVPRRYFAPAPRVKDSAYLRRSRSV